MCHALDDGSGPTGLAGVAGRGWNIVVNICCVGFKTPELVIELIYICI